MSNSTDRPPRRPLAGAASVIAAIAAAGIAAKAASAAAPARQPADAAAADADAARKLLLQANGRFARGLFRPAAADYQQFLRQFPGRAETTGVRYALAVCHYRLGEFDPVAGLLDPVLADAAFARKDEALAVLGHAHLSAGRHDPAAAAFGRLLADFPASAHAENAALARTQALYAGGRHADAVAAADAFATRYPKSADRAAAVYFKGLSQKARTENAAAAATLAGLLADHPGSALKPDALLALGQALEADGKLDQAAARYREVVAAAPAGGRPDAHYSLGVVYYKLGRYDDAVRELSAVPAAGGDAPYAKAARLQLGLAQLAGGRPAEARKTLSAVAAGDPPNAVAARYALARCDMADGKFDVALASLDELSRVVPPPADAGQLALDRGTCLAALDRHAEAAEAFATAAVPAQPPAPRSAEAAYRRAYSFHKLGRLDASHDLCARLTAAGDVLPAAFRPALAELSAENLFLLGRYRDAAAAYAALNKGVADTARPARHSFRLGQCAYSLGEYANAVDLLRPLVGDPAPAADATFGRAGLLLGDALLQQGKFAESAAAFRAYLAAAKPPAGADEQEAQYKLAVAQRRTGGGGAVAAAVTELLAEVAGGPDASAWTARARFELGQLAYQAKPPRLDEAAGHLAKVTAFGGGNPPADVAAPALYLLGWIDYENKRFADAAARWAALVEKHPTAPLAADAAFHRGVALRDAGTPDPALGALTAYADRYPGGQHAARARQLAAACLTSLKREPEARRVLAALADAAATATDAVLYDLAWAEKGTKDLVAAAGTYRRLLKDHPASPLAAAARTELAELLFADGRYQEAADFAAAAATDAAADGKVRSAAAFLLASCHDKLGNAEKAAEAFAGYAAAHAGEAQAGTALLRVGVARASLGRFDEAERAFAEVLEKYPQHPQAAVALLKLAEAQADAGRHADALASHERFLQRHPTDAFAARAQFGVGWAAENQKRYDAARTAYRKVTAGGDGETAARAQFQIGQTHLAEGDFEQGALALLVVEDVYADPRWSARALCDAGRAFEQLKQSDLARQQYEVVVTKYKDQADEAKLARSRLDVLTKK